MEEKTKQEIYENNSNIKFSVFMNKSMKKISVSIIN